MQSKELCELIQHHKTEVREFWKEFVLIAFIGFVVVFGLIFISVWFGLYEGTINWKTTAAIIWLVLLIPPLKMMYPERPTEEHVALNKVFNEIGSRVNTESSFRD